MISSISSRTSNNAFKGGSAFTLSALFEPKSENVYIIKDIFVFSENYHDIENFSQKHLKSYGKFELQLGDNAENILLRADLTVE